MGRGHFTAITIVGMMGFFTNAYNLVTLPPNVSAAVNGVTLCGTLAGQLFLSWLGDKLSRKKVYRITLALTVFSSLASGLCFFRFWLGFGIGGDYLLSATIMSSESTRGVYIASVFAVQGLGILTAAVVSIIASHVPQAAADNVWRIILMSGAVPAALTFYLRMRLPETARYTMAFTDHLGQGRRRFFIQLLGLGVFFMTLSRFNVDDIPFVFISFFFPNIHTIHKYWLSWDERCVPVAMAFPQLLERAPPQTLAHLNSLIISRLRIMRSETQQGFKPKSPFFFLAVVNYMS